MGASARTLTTSCVSTRCFHVPVRIVCRRVCVTLMASRKVPVRAFVSVKPCYRFVLETSKKFAIEALRRSKMKFPGRQNIYESKNWGFTKFKKLDYVRMRQSVQDIPDGNNCKYISGHGPLTFEDGGKIADHDVLPQDVLDWHAEQNNDDDSDDDSDDESDDDESGDDE